MAEERRRREEGSGRRVDSLTATQVEDVVELGRESSKLAAMSMEWRMDWRACWDGSKDGDDGCSTE